MFSDAQKAYIETAKKFAENALVFWGKKYKIRTNSVRLFHTYGPLMKLGDGRIHSDLVQNVIKKFSSNNLKLIFLMRIFNIFNVKLVPCSNAIRDSFLSFNKKIKFYI